MRDNNFRQDSMNQQRLENDELDRELNTALAKFAAAEPRRGLEERVLTSLRTEQQRAATKPWWRWPALAAAASALVVSVSVGLRSVKPLQNTGNAGARIANKIGGNPIRPDEAASAVRFKPHVVRRSATVVASAVKLDQFPSPQPLSDQEKILARYVTKYPEHAALIAQARTEALRRDRAEEMGEAAPTHDEGLQRSNN
jgi:hypothetical protein